MSETHNCFCAPGTHIIHAEEESEGFLLCFKSIVQVSLSVFSVELYFLLHYFSF